MSCPPKKNSGTDFGGIWIALVEGAESVAQDTVEPLRLSGIDVLVPGGLGRPLAPIGLADAPHELPKQAARKIRVVIHDQHIRDHIARTRNEVPCRG